MSEVRRPRKQVRTEDDVTPRLVSSRLEHRACMSGNGLTRVDGVLQPIHTPENLLKMYVNYTIQHQPALTKVSVHKEMPHCRRYYACPPSSETRYGNMRSATNTLCCEFPTTLNEYVDMQGPTTETQTRTRLSISRRPLARSIRKRQR
jgi:hypothetical protein